MKTLTDEEYWALPGIKRFWYRVQQLREDFPVDKVVIVRTKPYKTLFLNGHRTYGYCQEDTKNDCYLIFIERHDDIGVMVSTIWHEWSHLRTWKSGKHCKKFWEAFGTIYRFYQDGETK